MDRNDREFFHALAESWDTPRAHDSARLRELTARTGIAPARRYHGIRDGLPVPRSHSDYRMVIV
jgi:hypothetical protein